MCCHDHPQCEQRGFTLKLTLLIMMIRLNMKHYLAGQKILVDSGKTPIERGDDILIIVCKNNNTIFSEAC